MKGAIFMMSQQQFMDVAENCNDYYSIQRGIISSVNSFKSCYNCYNLKNGICEKGICTRATSMNEHF